MIKVLLLLGPVALVMMPLVFLLWASTQPADNSPRRNASRRYTRRTQRSPRLQTTTAGRAQVNLDDRSVDRGRRMNAGWYIIIALLWIILGWCGWISAAKMFYDKPVTWRMRLAFILAGSITLIVWSCIVIALGLLIVLCALIEPMERLACCSYRERSC